MGGPAMRRFLRVGVVPAGLMLATAAMFHRAFSGVDLARAAAAGLVMGGLAGWMMSRRRVPWPLGAVGVVVAFVGGVTVVAEGIFRPDLLPDALLVFLTVGLPARGLGELAVVPFVVLFTVMAVTVAMSARDRTLLTLAGPAAAVGAASVLVEPVGFAWWAPLAFAGAGSAVLLVDARTDLSQLPALVSTNTEARRQLVWWRPLVQVVPALVAVIALASVLPSAATLDVRRYVTPATERIVDPSPLAVAARASRLVVDDELAFATVWVEGAAPGRLRLAVLDAYAVTGWRQSADYAITGETLAPDPLYRGAGSPARSRLAAEVATVGAGANPAGLRGVPTAGMPASVEDPAGVRYSASAGVLLASESPRRLIYRTSVSGPAAPGVGLDATVGRFPPALASCPASPALGEVARQLTGDAPGAEERLSRIENYLKVRRVYDPASPGGQTLRSIERFVEQDFARGNLEVFVTSYALLARCAGVPVRVVVGLPAPVVGSNSYRLRDLTAWVETPLARSGWTVFDPLPTPDEQRQQAQLARQQEPEPEPEPEAGDPVPPVRQVEPRAFGDDGTSGVVKGLLVMGGLAGVIVLAWTLVLPGMVRRRRRRIADPALAVQAAWTTVTDALVDRAIALDVHHTPAEVVRVATGRVPVALPRVLAGMTPMVDRARYGGAGATPDDAGLAWGYAMAALERLPASTSTRLAALRRPRQAWARLASTFGVARTRRPWSAVLPDTAVLSTADAPSDIPGVSVAARIGEGSTGSVYRGVVRATGEAVAVKVFRYGPGDAGFDQQRYDWEVRIAREVSGLPQLPVVVDAGISPLTQRPYLVSSLYDDGTLVDRVRRGGPMTEDEVVSLGVDIGLALSTLHQLGVVHADVKPENVFSSRGGWVLGDLGSAWLRASRGPAASLTPPYAAPEVWRGAAPTPSADLYSLGLTMLFAVTGQVPIASNAPAADDVARAFPNHPVLLRVLEPDARRRPRSVADFARQLRPELVGTPTGARLSGLSLPTPTVTYRRD